MLEAMARKCAFCHQGHLYLPRQQSAEFLTLLQGFIAEL